MMSYQLVGSVTQWSCVTDQMASYIAPPPLTSLNQQPCPLGHWLYDAGSGANTLIEWNVGPPGDGAAATAGSAATNAVTAASSSPDSTARMRLRMRILPGTGGGGGG